MPTSKCRKQLRSFDLVLSLPLSPPLSPASGTRWAGVNGVVPCLSAYIVVHFGGFPRVADGPLVASKSTYPFGQISIY